MRYKIVSKRLKSEFRDKMNEFSNKLEFKVHSDY